MTEQISSRVKDETGMRYGRLVVLKYTGRAGGKSRHPKFLCICDCGNEAEVTGTNLRQSQTLSCGCLQKERTSDASKTHGLNGTPEHSSYYSMMYRCYKESDNNYENYGGRGIKVCDRWREPDDVGLINFINDMGERPEGTTLDRIDVDGDYCPENCRWITRDIQSYNTRKKVTNKTGRTGVHLSGHNTYNVKIGYKGKSINVGTYKTYEEACFAREQAEIKYYGVTKE